MTVPNEIMTIAIASLATFATRFLPFLIFSGKKETPGFVKYLGEHLPPAILGILVIYCYKSQILHPGFDSLLAFFAGLVTVALYYVKSDMLLAILFGSATYVGLVYLF